MGGGKTPKNTTQTNKVELSPEQQQIYNLAFPFIEQYANNPAKQYKGQTTAGFNANELAGQSGAIQAATGAGQGIADSSANATNFLLDPKILSPDSNPWLKASGDAIAARQNQNLTESILPSIRSGATVDGGMFSGGSSREGIAQGLAIGRTQQATGDALANLYKGAYDSGLSAIGGALKTAPLTQASQLFGSQVQGQVGAQQRALEQAKLDEARNNWDIQQSMPFLNAKDILSLLGGMPGSTGVSTVQGAQPGTNKAMGALGGAASGAALGSMIMPGIGTGVGAAGGALLALLMGS